MGVGPLTSIRAVSLLNPGKKEDCVPPPFAVDPCEMVGNDTYDSGSSRSDRGLEAEEEGAKAESEEDCSPAPQAVDPHLGVNLFA